MSAVPNPPSIAQYEQTCQTGLAADERQIRFRVENFGAKANHSPDEIAALINDLNGWLQRLHQYDPAAGYLTQQGRPSASQQLFRLTTDLQQAIRVYQEMHQSRAQFLNGLSNSQRQTQQDWLQTVQQTCNANRAASDAQYKKWNGLFTQSCANCGYSLGDLYFKLTICPSCGLLLRP